MALRPPSRRERRSWGPPVTAVAPPSPPPPPPPPPFPQEADWPGPSGEGDPEPSPSRGGSTEGDGASFFRWFSLGRLPGGMKRGGGRRAVGTEWKRLRDSEDWHRGPVKDTVFITRANSKIWLILTMAVVAGILHWYYISTLFEHDRHFSHLSTLEREMSFRTEMGLYYSYFKTIIEASSFWEGLWMIMNDRLTEYPLVINTLKRFNLYPEVVLASWYRIYIRTMNALGIQTKACWTVNRGEGLSPVESCEGFGDPASFYVAMIFVLNGLMVSVFFLYGVYLSGSKLGGLLTVACYFFNHGESTRVMWTPPLRESFSYPFLVVQMLLLTYVLRTQNVNRRSLIALSVSNVFFMLPWQFAQFILLTQVVSVFGIYVVGFIDSCKLQKILHAHMASLGVCFILMFGNSMLLTSYYAASLVVCWGIHEVSSKYLNMHRNDISLWAIEGFSCLFGTVILKSLMCLLFGVTDDAHISNLLKAKLTGYRDFDTSMYTCAAEFDFMGYETPVKYLKTFLLPVVFLVLIVIAAKTYQYVVHSKKSTER